MVRIASRHNDLAGDASARERLVTRHFGLVRHIARRLVRSLSAYCELDELVSAGSIGLLRALDSFDASRGHAFSTFAMPRIRGAMLDELRRQDHVPRSIRRKARELRMARERLGGALGRRPNDAEVAAHLSLDLPTLWRWESAVEQTVSVPIDGATADTGESPALVEWLIEHSPTTIEDELTRESELRLAREALEELKEQERVIVTQFYLEERTLKEIGAALGMTESRVCQVRAKALATLRASLWYLREDVAA
jgi:RNA polymerase sigma factor for flagellar operon FliA